MNRSRARSRTERHIKAHQPRASPNGEHIGDASASGRFAAQTSRGDRAGLGSWRTSMQNPDVAVGVHGFTIRRPARHCKAGIVRFYTSSGLRPWATCALIWSSRTTPVRHEPSAVTGGINQMNSQRASRRTMGSASRYLRRVWSTSAWPSYRSPGPPDRPRRPGRTPRRLAHPRIEFLKSVRSSALMRYAMRHLRRLLDEVACRRRPQG